MKIVRRSWKVGLVFFLLLLVFGPVTCTFFDRESNLTGPAIDVSGPAAANFYASRGLYDDQYGIYSTKGEFVLNIPQAGRHWIFYQTTIGDFVLIVEIEAAALIYVGMPDDVEATAVYSDIIPDDVILPASTALQMALSSAPNPNVTLLVSTRVIPIYTTDVTYCQDEDCVINEVKDWIVETPSYIWPDGRTQGTLTELYELTQGSEASKLSAAVLQESINAKGLDISILLSSQYSTKDNGCYCYANQTQNATQMQAGDVHDQDLANGEACEGDDDCISNYCSPYTNQCEDRPPSGGGSGYDNYSSFP